MFGVDAGLLSAQCSLPTRQSYVELTFDDPVSDRGARVSVTAWKIWGVLFATVMIAFALRVIVMRRFQGTTV